MSSSIWWSSTSPHLDALPPVLTFTFEGGALAASEGIAEPQHVSEVVVGPLEAIDGTPVVDIKIAL